MKPLPPLVMQSVKVTIKNLMTAPPTTIRMELNPDETVAEILWAVQEFWRYNLAGISLKMGRWLLDPEWTVRDMNLPTEGTVIELIPNPAFDGNIRKVY